MLVRQKLFIAALLTLWMASAHSQEVNRVASDPGKPAGSIASVKWLAGRWQGEEKGTTTEEHWMEPRGGMMPGMNRSVSRNGKSSFEFLRIAETPKGLTYFASPEGRAATPYLLKEVSNEHAVFENREEDFPEQIIYRRDGASLKARIEGMIGGKEASMEWNWKSVP